MEVIESMMLLDEFFDLSASSAFGLEEIPLLNSDTDPEFPWIVPTAVTPTTSRTRKLFLGDQDDPNKKIGEYTRAERLVKISLYRDKRARAKAGGIAAYRRRSQFAATRPRVGGRFTKKDTGDWQLADQQTAEAKFLKELAKAAQPKRKRGRPRKQ